MEENIRDPDQPFYDRLIDDDYTTQYAPPIDSEDELEHAIQQSQQEYESIERNALYESQEKEREERLHKFDNIKKICKRIVALSRNETERTTLELFLYFIGLYETDYINQINTEPEFYNNLFSILKSTRITREEINMCLNFISLNENI